MVKLILRSILSDIRTTERGQLSLPDRAFVSLTEAFTSILTGECLNDSEVTIRQQKAITADVSTWTSPHGPEGLVYGLRLVANGDEPDSSLGEDIRQFEEREMERARHWLAENHLAPQDGLARAERELDRRESEEARFKRLEALLYRFCGEGSMTLYGRPAGPKRRPSASQPVPIPKLFFADRNLYATGNGYYGPGELARVEPDESRLADANFNNVDDDPTSYIEVKLSRDEAERLNREFSEREGEHLRRTLWEQISTGEKDPATADEELEAAGLAPLIEPPDPKLCDPMSKSSWTLAMTIAWIATRDIRFVTMFTNEYVAATSYHWALHRLPDEAGGGGIAERFILSRSDTYGPILALQFHEQADGQFEGELKAKGLMSAREAERELWAALLDEKLTAIGLAPEKRRHVPIPAYEFNGLLFQSHLGEDRLCSMVDPDWKRPLYREVVVKREDVIELWPADSSCSTDSLISAERPSLGANRLGRKEVYAWSKVEPLFLAHFHEYGAPGHDHEGGWHNREAVIVWIQEQFIEIDGREPSRSIIQHHLKRWEVKALNAKTAGIASN